jgi:EmrB/QacA subfamily drug resistance transporter
MKPGYLLSTRATLAALSGTFLCMLLAALNQTIVTTAVPQMVADLGDVQRYSWVFTAYMLTLTVTTPVYGRLSDIHGRRPFFVGAILIFIAGTMLCGTAMSMGQLVVGRGIQGLGAGGLVPLAFATIADLVPPSDRGRWQGLTGAVIGVGTCAGPVAGGWIADGADWRWVFFVSLPLALIALVVVSVTLRIPPHPNRGTKVDFVGAALMAAFLTSGLIAVAQAQSAAPLLYGVSAVALLALVLWELWVDQPIIPIELFRQRVFTLSALSSFVFAIAMFTAIQYTPLQVQAVLGSTVTTSGLVMVALMLSMMIASIGSGRLISRIGRYRWALVSAPIAMGAGYVLLATMNTKSSIGLAVVAMVLIGAGVGLFNQNVLLAVQNGVPSWHAGAATSTTHAFRSVGGVIGVSVAGALITAGLPPGADVALGLGGDAAMAADVFRDQLAAALRPVFVVGVPLMVGLLAVVMLIPELPLRQTVRETPSSSTSAMPA